MFTWICPKCGAEVPPSYDQCPRCADAEPAKPAATAAPAPPAPPPQPVSAAVPPPPPITPVAQPAPPQPQVIYVKQGPPGWLVTLGVAGVMVAAGWGLYSFLGSRNETAGAASVSEAPPSPPPSEAPKVEETKPAPAAASKPKPSDEPSLEQIAKYLEACGLRIKEENKRPVVVMTIVNHSAADLPLLNGSVTIRSSTGESVATVPLKLNSLAPYEAKDMSVPLITTKRAYEMPDWQFLKAEITLR